MKKIKTGALVLLVVLTLDHMCYVFFSFPSIYHYATLHSFFEKWYALILGCCAMLTLLHLGIKNIRLGPTIPAFISPNVLDFLVEKFSIAPVTTPEEDLKAILGNK